jgi:hypothetical protein
MDEMLERIMAKADEAARLIERAERMEKALRDIEAWARAYPLSVFPEPDAAAYVRAKLALAAEGITLDAISASAMRHVLSGVINLVKDGLHETES